MRRLNIAIVAHGGVGGGQFSQGIPWLVDLIERLALVHNVTVFIAGMQDPGFKPQGYTIKVAAQSPSGNFYKRLWLLFLLLKNDRQKFDVIHSIWGYPWCLPALLKSILTGVPVVISLMGGEVADLPEINYGAMRKFTGKMISKWAYRRAAALTCLSRFQAEKLSAYGIKRKIEIIPLGADPDKFPFVQKEYYPPYNFLHIANLTKVKDQETLLRTFKLIADKKDCRLKIIGSGEEETGLKNLCRILELNDRIEFTGFVKHNEISSHFRNAHFLLHTSVWEGQGVVVAEAAASGALICGTRTGLISDLGDDCTVNEEVKQPGKLAAKVLEIMDRESEMRKKINKAYIWAQSHTAQFTADQVSRIYNYIEKNRYNHP